MQDAATGIDGSYLTVFSTPIRFQGATLEAAWGDGSGASSMVTFAELTTSGTHFNTSMHTVGGAS